MATQKYHYRIINKSEGEVIYSSEGRCEPYSSRAEASRAGDRQVLILGYISKMSRVSVVPAEENKEQTNS